MTTIDYLIFQFMS